ncbi:hypothetical protein HZ994_04055 [Akkermansiaceae bacterium]|nr:hypothetical protein HZ994_04055 [Akkermansiaceae bacterium]
MPAAVVFTWLPLLFLASRIAVAQGEIESQPAPRAVPVEELLPRFEDDGVVISRSEQFRISGGDAATRGTAANLAEDTKDEFLRLTEEKETWKVPVRITLMGKPGDPVPMRDALLRLNHTDDGYEIIIFANLSRGLRPEPFRRAVMEALVYASGLSGKPYEENRVFTVPPWFVEGMQEASAWRLGQSDRRLYDALFRHGGVFRLEGLFSLSEADYASIDAATKAAFRISSGALVMALLEQPDGKEGMRAFLAELASYEGEMPALLRRHFPDLNLSATSLAKWWALQLANKGAAPLTESLGVTQTDKALDEALKLRLHDAEGGLLEIPVLEWESVAALPDAERTEAVRLAQDDLLRLSYRSFPSYRMLLLEYQALLSDLTKGKTGDMQESLAALAETRRTMVAKAERGRDFMDWFEITRARETSGAFDDYLNLKARLKNRPNPRKDGMSAYLDRLDPLFTLPDQPRQDPFGGGLPPF